MTITHADDVLIEGTLDVEGDVTLDDGSGDSPKIQLVGGSNDDTSEMYVLDDGDSGESDLIISAPGPGSASHIILQGRFGTSTVGIDLQGDVAIARTLTMTMAAYLGSVTLTGDLQVPDGGTIGGVLAPEITFDLTGNEIELDPGTAGTVKVSQGDLVLDEGGGDSPSLKLVGGSNDDTVEIFLDDHGTQYYSDAVIKLCDTGGESRLEIRDSAAAVVASINSDGGASINDLTVNDTTTLNGAVTISGEINANMGFQDACFQSEVSGQVGLNVLVMKQKHTTGEPAWGFGPALSFCILDQHDTLKQIAAITSSVRVWGDSTGEISIMTPGHCATFRDGNVIVEADLEVGDELRVTGESWFEDKVGIGTASPSTLLHLYDSAADVALRLETDKADGASWIYFVNDATSWTAGIAGGDDFQIRDAALCVLQLTASDNALTLPNLATNSLKIKDAGTAAATEDGWIAIEIDGSTKYLRAWDSK